MKLKNLLIIAVLVLAVSNVNAEFKFKGVGAGLSIGTKAGIDDQGDSKAGMGINIHALAQIVEKIDIDVTYVYYFPSEPVDGFKFTFSTFSVNGHYNFIQNDGFDFFALAGINYAMGKVEIEGVGDNSDSETGLNLGAGINYDLSDKLAAYGQAGLTFGDADQMFINLGVMYKF